MAVMDRIRHPFGPKRDTSFLSLDQYIEMLNYGGWQYPLNTPMDLGSQQEEPNGDFEGYSTLYRGNPIIFGLMRTRRSLFSEARFKYRQLRSGRPGKLFGDGSLARLETPWPNGTTGDLLQRMIDDVDLGGNFYAVRRANGLKRMRPDWVTIVIGSLSDKTVTSIDLDAQVVGYLYHPGGKRANRDPVPLVVEEVAHWAPIPDPCSWYRGMSWLTPVIREVMADNAASVHKLKFFENGSTPNIAIKMDPAITMENWKKWVEIFEEKFGEATGQAFRSAYKTLYLGGGADVSVIGANLRQVAFKETQGAGETRVAVAAGVPPVIAGLSEGLQAATYSNYAQARRCFADMTMRPLWRSAAASMAPMVNVPKGSELWYDDRDIPALREDQKDEAEIQATQAIAMKTLVDSGFDADSVRDAVLANDYSLLKHTGMTSVQLLPPGSPSSNGTGDPAKVPVPTGDNGA